MEQFELLYVEFQELSFFANILYKERKINVRFGLNRQGILEMDTFYLQTSSDKGKLLRDSHFEEKQKMIRENEWESFERQVFSLQSLILNHKEIRMKAFFINQKNKRKGKIEEFNILKIIYTPNRFDVFIHFKHEIIQMRYKLDSFNELECMRFSVLKDIHDQTFDYNQKHMERNEKNGTFQSFFQSVSALKKDILNDPAVQTKKLLFLNQAVKGER